MKSSRRLATLAVGLLLVGLPGLAVSASASPWKERRTAKATAYPWTANQLTPGGSLSGHGAGDWAATGGRLDRAGDGIRVTTTGAWALARSGSSANTWVRAAPGSVWKAALNWRVSGPDQSVLPYVLFYDSAGKELARVRGQLGTGPAGAWRSVTPPVAIAPAATTHVALGVLLAGTSSGDGYDLANARLTRSMSTPTGVVGPLHTSGNTLYDANGPLVLRGLHRFGLETRSTAAEAKLTTHEITRMRAWGANVVRVSLSQSFWLPGCHQDPNYPTAIDAVVRDITSQGMVALLDLHTGHRGSCGPIGPQLMADTDSLVFWQQVATRHQANPLVAFDLFNEPHDIDDRTWLHGGPVTVSPSGRVTEGSSGQVGVAAANWEAAGMQELYAAVRGTGAANVVVITGNDWGNRLPSPRVQGSNIVYGAHAYTCPSTVGGADCTADPTDPTKILEPWLSVAASVPVAVTEFGWPSSADGTYARNLIEIAARQGWGWVAFAWDGSTSGQFGLVSDVGPDAAYQPSPAGMPVLAGLQG